MGKLLCDSTTIAETFQTSSLTVSWREPQSSDLEAVDLVDQTEGVLWKQPRDHGSAVVFRLSHGGEVSPDGNCLFTASQRAMAREIDARELRRRAVKLFVEDLRSVIEDERESINKGYGTALAVLEAAAAADDVLAPTAGLLRILRAPMAPTTASLIGT
ncbi:hypothetical protein SLEP1_g11604 [Rubroshorea leprosula]|nr:hypothetical protein SLEP1_g11604 [Rubroshorea leprosula]